MTNSTKIILPAQQRCKTYGMVWRQDHRARASANGGKVRKSAGKLDCRHFLNNGNIQIKNKK